MSIKSEEKSDDNTRTHVQLETDTAIGHYRVIGKIGAGGMGEVYLARDTRLDREVALKFLPAHLSQDSDCRARFVREARASAKLDHPNIVAVHEVGEFQGRPFFSMQHIPGESLRDLLSKGSLPLDRILQIATQLCEGIQAAHNKGVTHRDIKPSNILIDLEGRARIVDFGLALVAGSENLTRAGSTLGTIGYMSPEQVRGEKLDSRSDIFSLGIVLYEMIAGRAPFRADSEAATLYAIMSKNSEPLSGYRPDVTPRLQGIVDKALSKTVTERYQSADELAADLKSLATSAAPLPFVPRRPSRRVVVWTAIATALLGICYWSGPKIIARFSHTEDPGYKMVAVLPLENIGPAEREFFADGLTDEIISKLGGISGLRVIARSSAEQYRKTTKTIAQVGKELGVAFLLQGTVRWERMPDGSQHLRVNPHLVQVSDGAQLWSQSYEVALAGIFSVQADIATRVSRALGVALLTREQEAIDAIPTSNIEAYEYYLRGYEKWGQMNISGPREAVTLFQKAIELDSTFAQAYAYLSVTHTWLYFRSNCTDKQELDEAEKAMKKTLEFDPSSALADLVQGRYYYQCFRDYARALAYLSSGLEKAPSNIDLVATTAYALRRQGNFARAAEMLQRCALLDPAAGHIPYEQAVTYFCLRDYSNAENYFRRATIITPEDFALWGYWSRLYVAWRGDTKAGRDVLRDGASHVDNVLLGRDFWYLDLLDHNYAAGEQHLLGTLASGELDSSLYYFSRAWDFRLQGDSARSRAFFDTLRVINERLIASDSSAFMAYSNAGLAYAGLGRRDAALALGTKSAELMPLAKDALMGQEIIHNLALIQATVGESESANDNIERLLNGSTEYSAHVFQKEPYWAPLKDNPRFRKLIGL